MSLINCDECAKEFSDRATACPNCGNPTLLENRGYFDEGRAVTIQKTFKIWKLVKLLSWITIIIGFFSLPNGEGGGVVLIVLGIIGLIIGKLGAWWTTG